MPKGECPIGDGHRPLFHDIHHSQKQGLENRVVIGESGLATSDFAKRRMETLHQIGGVYHASDGQRQIKQPLDMLEVIDPHANRRWVFRPLLLELFQRLNQPGLYEDVKLYFDDPVLLPKCAYTKTVVKARSGIGKREYWQTEDIDWITQKKGWAGLRTIAMTCNTITRNGEETSETRYFISSLPLDVKEIARAIRGHWIVESYHWHLDVTFREDDNHTLEKQAAFNLNILRKLAMNVLRIFETGKKSMSLN